jgi:hypothetical protein
MTEMSRYISGAVQVSRQVGSVSLRPHDPAVDLALVGEKLVRPEPDRQLGRGALGAVRCVDEVLPHLDREVAAYRPRSRFERSRRTVHGSNVRNRVRPFERKGDERRGRDERDQALEERLALVDGIVALGQRSVDVDQLESDDLEAALFVAGDDPAGQKPLDAVGLDEYECSLGHFTDTPADD